MTVFVDTSAILALVDADDKNHRHAGAAWKRLDSDEARLLTSNYVMLETLLVAQRRLGMEAVRAVAQDIAPLFDLVFVDEAVHQAAVNTMLAAGRRQLSVVDCSSFELMRRHGVRHAYAYDPHFTEQGFTLER